MTIACTRCGASCEGDIILPALSFRFKHNSGCGHGVGPLAVLPSAKKVEKKKESAGEKHFGDKSEKIIESIIKDDVKIEEKPKKKFGEKLKVFGNQEKSDGQ